MNRFVLFGIALVGCLFFGRSAEAEIRLKPGAGLGVQNGAYMGFGRLHLGLNETFEVGVELGRGGSIVEIGSVPVTTVLLPLRLNLMNMEKLNLFVHGMVGYASFGGDANTSGAAYGGGFGMGYALTDQLSTSLQLDILGYSADVTVAYADGEESKSLFRFLIGLDYAF